MRGATGLAAPAPDWTVLAALLAAAAGVLLGAEVLGGAPAIGYRVLSWLLLGGAAAYAAYLYGRHPTGVDLWAILLLFSALFFSAGGIVELDSVVSSSPRVSLAVQALFVLTLGLIASRLAFRLVRPRPRALARSARLAVRIQATHPAIVVAVAAVVWTLRAYSATQGQVLSHAGDVMPEVGADASLLIQAAQLGRPLTLFLGALVLMTPHRPGRRALGLILMASELVYAVLWARRLLLEVVVALLLAGLWSRRRLRWRSLLGYAAVAAFATMVMWPFMFHLRAVANSSGLYQTAFGGRTETLLRQVLPEAVATFDLRASFEGGSAYLDNVHDRAHMLDLLLDVMAAQRDGVPVMGGQALATALVAAVPRALWPAKAQLMATGTWQVEERIEEHFGLPLIDMASTVLTQGYADGGVPGVLLYLALLGGALGVAERSFGTARSALLGLYVYALGASLAMQIEANVTDLLVVARLGVVLLVVDRLAGDRIEAWATQGRLGRAAGAPWPA